MNAPTTFHIDTDHSPPAIWRRAFRRSVTEGRAESSRKWKARAIGLNSEPLHNAIALSGMAPLQFDDRWVLAVAWPQPAPVDDPGDDIQDVILIDPTTGNATMMGDIAATHVAPVRHLERLTILTDAKAWARAVALERLQQWKLRQERHRVMQALPTWIGDAPAALILSDLKRIRWSAFNADVIEVPTDLRRDVQRAVLAQARLPKIEGRA